MPMSKKRQPPHSRRAWTKKKQVPKTQPSSHSKAGIIPNTSHIPWFYDTHQNGGALTLGSWSILPRPIVP